MQLTSDIVSPDQTKLQWSDRLLRRVVLPFIPWSLRPNHVTLFRMFATPFVLLLLMRGQYRWAIPVFLFVAFTDALDGAMARTRNQITNWGRIYDPVADKMLIGSVVIIFVMRELDVILGLAILGIEVLFVFSAWWMLKTKRLLQIQANRWGKIKMFLQVVGVTALLFAVITDWPPLIPFSRATFVLAIVFALVSLVTYGI